MAIQSRTLQPLSSPGPFIGVVTNHLDLSFMGSLEVAISIGVSNDPGVVGQSFIVNYLSPFYGVTSVTSEGNNETEFDSVQKSYGMWMVPPDIGTKVMVIFVNGDPNQGYWFGCIQDKYQNHMIPGIAASTNVHISQSQKEKYDTDLLPVAEFHKRSVKKEIISANSQKKPIHPFADRLLEQGLLADNIRGLTSSSARREAPSNVFGISTPGPVDPTSNSTISVGGFGNTKKITNGKLGGSTFVMDDGDINGDNELVRIRTRTGHQILLHNTKDLIYIANAKGTAWIELTSNGKIDIFAQDSVSIHTANDFNFRADRDINLEAGRNFNLRVGASMNVNVEENYSLKVDQTGKISFGETANVSALDDIKVFSGADVNISSGAAMKITSGDDTNINAGGNILETGAEIHMNGPAAAEAEKPENPVQLQLFSLPSTSVSEDWGNGNRYKSDNINSIMQRVPMHEPWTQHEEIDRSKFSPENTDVSSASAGSGVNKSLPPKNSDQPAEWSNDDEFIKKVISVSSALGCDHIDLLSCMAFETGRTFDPSLRNSIGATGLIQFLKSTAISLGTTTDYLGTLTRTEQMDYVYQYFKASPLSKIKQPSLEDLYMAILWPKAVGQSNDYVLFSVPSVAYSQNSGLDVGKKGYITKADAAAKVRNQIPYVQQQLANAGY